MMSTLVHEIEYQILADHVFRSHLMTAKPDNELSVDPSGGGDFLFSKNSRLGERLTSGLPGNRSAMRDST
jgi:hypothetical protein